MIRAALASDSARICDIYNHYVETTVVTFEEQPVSSDDMAQRILDVSAKLPWLVAEIDGTIAGYAYAAPWKSRASYRFSVETTIYLAPQSAGRGLGRELYGALLDELRMRRLHCAIGGVALPNPASVALHEKLGFSKVAEFKEVGWKLDRWVDVGYWELLL